MRAPGIRDQMPGIRSQVTVSRAASRPHLFSGIQPHEPGLKAQFSGVRRNEPMDQMPDARDQGPDFGAAFKAYPLIRRNEPMERGAWVGEGNNPPSPSHRQTAVGPLFGPLTRRHWRHASPEPPRGRGVWSVAFLSLAHRERERGALVLRTPAPEAWEGEGEWVFRNPAKRARGAGKSAGFQWGEVRSWPLFLFCSLQ